MPEELPSELKESAAELYLEAGPEISEYIYKYWLPRIVAAAYEGISEAPPEHRDKILMKMSKACSAQADLVLGCQPGMDWEQYKKHLAELQPPLGPRKVTQIGDVVFWTYVPPKGEDGRAICQCPLIRLGMMEGRPEVCACSANSVSHYIEGYTGRQVATVETLGSPMVNGEDECRFLIHLKPVAFSTPKHET